MRSRPSSLILAEHLRTPAEPIALVLEPSVFAAPAAVAARAAAALLDLSTPPSPEDAGGTWPEWLAPHQVPAARRLAAIVDRYGGAVLADAVGLGKSYVALAVARHLGGALVLVMPAVLLNQWRALLSRLEIGASIITHEALSRTRNVGPTVRPSDCPALFLVDEAHRFRNPDTLRYRALARLTIGARVLLISATPVHNRLADLFQLFRLFARDHALAELGIPSLACAARGEVSPETAGMVAARLVVARSRSRIREGYGRGGLTLRFPDRAEALFIRAGTARSAILGRLISGISTLAGTGAAGPLFRLLLLRRLASSLPALQQSLGRYQAYLQIARGADAAGRALSIAEFEQLFPRNEEGDVQLGLLPLLLEPGGCEYAARDAALLPGLRQLARAAGDPKADALRRLLESDRVRTIVFTDAEATARHLARLVRGRVGLIAGGGGMLGGRRASRAEVLAAFAPRSQGLPAAATAREVDVLIATDVLSEGLNLQDAARVIHYDLPWSPARLSQRAGRIDRLGSTHDHVAVVTFLPQAQLNEALRMEERIIAKLRMQEVAGTAEMESLSNAPVEGSASLDWCDRLHSLAAACEPAEPGCYAIVRGAEEAAVVVVRIGRLAEAIVIRGDRMRADPALATGLFEQAVHMESAAPPPSEALAQVTAQAAPLVRARLAAVADARWRAADRCRLSRRLIPWVLAAARRAARLGLAGELAALDALVTRLSLGMTAGEELTLDDLTTKSEPLTTRDLRSWHEKLPPVDASDGPPAAELVALLLIRKS